jgi:hypothetical protein
MSVRPLPVRPAAAPSPLARRQALRQELSAALQRRDAAALQRLSSLWVHRQGVSSLPALMQELAQAESLVWWQELLEAPTIASTQPPVEPAQLPVAPPVQQLPVLPRLSRPAPAPSHPALARLRSWLPDVQADAELPRAA